ILGAINAVFVHKRIGDIDNIAVWWDIVEFQSVLLNTSFISTFLIRGLPFLPILSDVHSSLLHVQTDGVTKVLILSSCDILQIGIGKFIDIESSEIETRE